MRIPDYYADRLTHDDVVKKYSRTARALKHEPGSFETFLAEMEAARNSRPDTNIVEASGMCLQAKDMTARDTLLTETAKIYSQARSITTNEASRIRLQTKDMTAPDTLLEETAKIYALAKDTSGHYDAVFTNAARNIRA